MQTKYNQLKATGRLLLCCLLIPLLPACESIDSLSDEEVAPDATILFSATLQAVQTKPTPSYPPEGIYYLGYTESATPVVKPVTIGKSGQETDTGFYWINVTKDRENKNEATFTLTNVKENGTCATEDILWQNYKGWAPSPLTFRLTHLMAQVKVSFTLAADYTISKVCLKQMGTGVKFDRAAGTVTPTAIGEIVLKELRPTQEAGTICYTALLPAQARTDAMQLYVATNKGNFARTLPKAMSQATSDGNREDIILSFRSGYILELEAGIKNNLDLTILFTGATLKDWQYKATAIIPAKPCGIYTANELDAWAKTYNVSHAETNYKLLKYGVYSSNKWTFYLRRNIDASAESTTSVGDFADKLESDPAGYKIGGITKSQLFTGTMTGTVADDLFKNN